MKKCALICILLVLAAGLNATAAVRVTNLFLEKNSQYTEFTIACDRDFKFEHQIVEADQNKPFRIVVDVLDAVHRLPQWDFEEIPKGSITRSGRANSRLNRVKWCESCSTLKVF
jgi:hypothetical protein